MMLRCVSVEGLVFAPVETLCLAQETPRGDNLFCCSETPEKRCIPMFGACKSSTYLGLNQKMHLTTTFALFIFMSYQQKDCL
jgi:hypothetical protein